MKKILLLLATIISCNISFTQNVDRVNDSVNVLNINHDTVWLSRIINNLDSNGTYFIFSTSYNFTNNIIYKIDDNLNVIDSFLAKNNYGYYKLHDKYYGLAVEDTTINNKISINKIYYYYTTSSRSVDSVKTIYDCMNDSIRYMHYCKAGITNEYKNVVFLVGLSNSADTVFRSKIILFDTLGNILNSKTYNVNVREIISTGVDFFVNKNNLEIDRYFSNVQYHGPFMIYHIDKNTLEITDTAVYDTIIAPEHRIIINDSVCVSVSNAGSHPIEDCDYFPVYIYNTKTNHLIDTIRFSSSSYSEPFFGGWNDKCMDFIKPDSIYLCYYGSDSADMGNFYCLHIANFNINGHVNFIYKLIGDEYYPSGVQATKDGGVIITLMIEGKITLVKFMPNGLVSISTVNKEDVFVLTYPNPVSNELNVVSSEKMNKVEIINTLGQVVFQKKLSNKNLTINTSNFVKGNYIVNINTDKGKTTKKVIVE